MSQRVREGPSKAIKIWTSDRPLRVNSTKKAVVLGQGKARPVYLKDTKLNWT